MILNHLPVDPNRLKIVILSTPKTGNTWLRWLLHYAYRIQIVDLPEEWAPGCADDLPESFVTHQHLFPSEGLVRWLVESRAVVLTTIRHPGDTFLSLFHYAKWHDAGPAAMLKQDGDRPGKNALKCINYLFPQIYAMSLAWDKLGSHVVRYEDLLADPLSQLREITSKIVPLNEERLKTAVLFCKPEYLTRVGVVDPRHLRTGTAGGWIQELPSEIVDAMASIQPYASACEIYDYDWNRSALKPSGYDYNKIDPFRGHDRFDNGESIDPWLAKIYFEVPNATARWPEPWVTEGESFWNWLRKIDPFRGHDRFDNGELIDPWLAKIYFEVPNATARWPEPWVTEGESFWNWLRAPSTLASLNPDLPAGTLTNLMIVMRNLRRDLQLFRDPADSDRMRFVRWFLGQAPMVLQIAWGLVEPAFKSYCDYLNSMSFDPLFRQPTGRITQLTVLDAHGARTNSFRCSDHMQIELEFQLDDPVDKPLIQYSLCNVNDEVLFGTDSELLGTTLSRLAPGRYLYSIVSTLSVQPQDCLVYVGLACLNSADAVVPIHRMCSQERITVIGGNSQGAAWCSTRIAMTRRNDP
jgi:hypothetical protein